MQKISSCFPTEDTLKPFKESKEMIHFTEDANCCAGATPSPTPAFSVLFAVDPILGHLTIPALLLPVKPHFLALLENMIWKNMILFINSNHKISKQTLLNARDLPAARLRRPAATGRIPLFPGTSSPVSIADAPRREIKRREQLRTFRSGLPWPRVCPAAPAAGSPGLSRCTVRPVSGGWLGSAAPLG